MLHRWLPPNFPTPLLWLVRLGAITIVQQWLAVLAYGVTWLLVRVADAPYDPVTAWHAVRDPRVLGLLLLAGLMYLAISKLRTRAEHRA